MTIAILSSKVASLARSTKRTSKVKYVVVIFGTAMALMGYGFITQSTLSSMTENSDTTRSTLLALTDETKDIHQVIAGLENEVKNSKDAVSKLGSSFEDLQSEVSTLKSMVEEVRSSPRTASISSTLTSASTSSSDIVSESIERDDVIKGFIKAAEGDGWRILDLNDDSNPNNFSCDMVDFKSSTGRPTGHKICVHRFTDVISNTIRTHGDWGDCRGLSASWNNEVKDTDNNPIYIEVGANIGSCVMEMLYSTNAPIVAFEPNPKNLYPLKKTLQGLPKSYQERVVVFPIALGASHGSSKIYSASNNMGNSHVDKGVADLDLGPQHFDPKDIFPIKVERLDSILNPGFNVPLLKLDAQGFECEILKGMGHDLASTVKHIHFEKSDRFLNAHGCNNLLSRLRELGFHIYQGNVEIGPSRDHTTLPNDLEARRSHP